MTGLAVRLGHRTSMCSRQQAENCSSALVLPHAYRLNPDLTKRVHKSSCQVDEPENSVKRAQNCRISLAFWLCDNPSLEDMGNHQIDDQRAQIDPLWRRRETGLHVRLNLQSPFALTRAEITVYWSQGFLFQYTESWYPGMCGLRAQFVTASAHEETGGRNALSTRRRNPGRPAQVVASPAPSDSTRVGHRGQL